MQFCYSDERLYPYVKQFSFLNPAFVNEQQIFFSSKQNKKKGKN
jgi:hypothetical protein